FVSLELAPDLAHDVAGSIRQARELFARVDRPNVLIKVPGTEAGAQIIEDLIFEGIPVNVTLLFSPAHYRRAAEAYLTGIERRIEADRAPRIASVASLFISRWDKASSERLPETLRNRLGIAIGMQTYREFHELYESKRWQRLADRGAVPQRLLWAS